jgi:hypothetical protein
MFVESKEPSYSIEELRKPPGNLEKLESETRYLLFLSFHHLLSNKNSPHSRKMEENSFLPALRLLLVSTPTPNSCSLRTPIAKPKSKVPSYSIEELRKPPGNLEKLESETRYLLFLSFHPLLSSSRFMEENSFSPCSSCFNPNTKLMFP